MEVGALDDRLDTLGGDLATALGGGAAYSATTGDVSAPSYQVGATSYNNVGAAIGAVNSSLTTINTTGIKYFHTNSTDADSVASGTASTAIGPVASAGAFSQAMGGNSAATGDTSVAIGDRATVAAAATRGVALGPSSTASAVNAVALGNGATAGQAGAVAIGASSTTAAAVATTGATIAGTAYTFAGAAPASTVSLGTTSSQRTLTNLAAGRLSGTSTDGVNGSQLFATNQAVETVNTRLAAADDKVDALGNGTAAGLGGGATYDPVSGTLTAPTYQIGGTTYTSVGGALDELDNRIDNVAAGATKYFHANSSLADSVASGTDSVAIGPQAASSAADAVAMGRGATAGQAGAVALGTGSVTAAAVATAGATIAGTAYTFAGATPASAVSIGSGGSERTLTNVAAGRVSATSTDAVNGSQLFATHQAVEAVSTQASAADDKVDALGNSAAAGLGGGSTYVPATGTLTAPSYSVGGATVNNVGDAIANLDGRTTGNTTAITNLGDAIDNGTVGLVQQDTTTRQLTVGAATDGTRVDFTGTAGTRQLTGVSLGVVTATSTDAINGSQLWAGNSSVAAALGGGSTINPDGTVAAPVYQVGGATYNNVGSALDELDNRIDSVAAGATRYFHANSSLADSTATGIDSVAVGPAAVASANSAMALGNAATAGQAGAVALGAASVTAAAVATPGATIAGTAYTFAGVTPASTVSIGSGGNERTLTNLAAGRVAASSTDAINGSQLFATHQALDAINTQVGVADDKVDALGGGAAAALGGGAAYDPATGVLAPPSYSVGGGTVSNVGDAITNLDGRTTSNTTAITNLGDAIGNGTVGLVQQDPGTRRLTVGAATDGTQVDFTGTGGTRQLTGVSIGTVSTTSTDAINGSQLFAGNSSIAGALGGGSTINPDGTVSAPTYQVGGNTYHSVGDAIGGIDVTLGGIVNGGGIKYFRVRSVAADATASGDDSLAAGPLANAEGTSATALGHGANALSNDTVAVGHGAVAGVSGGNSGETAVGANAQATADNAAAFGAGATAAQVGAVALGAGSQTAAAVATPSAVIAGTTYAYAGAAPASTVSIGVAGSERTLTNLAAGRVSASSTDAVNGSQLFAAHQAIDANGARIGVVDGKVDAMGGAMAQGLGGGATYDAGTGGITAPTYHINGTDYDNVGDALNHLAIGGVQSIYFHANSTLADSQAQGTDSIAVGPEANSGGANAVAMGHGANAAQDGAVALGSGSTTEVAVGTASVTVAGTTYAFAGAAPTSAVSIGSAGTERTLTHLAAGRISADSTDAVNGSQLYATNQSVDGLASLVGAINSGGGIKYFRANSNGADATASGTDSVAIGPAANASATNSIALGNAATATHDNSIALGAGAQTTTGAQSGYNGAYVGSSSSVGEVALGGRTVSGVAAGSLGTDATNVSQLAAGVNYAINVANSYTDAQINQLISQGGGDSALFQVSAPTRRMPTVAGTDAVAGGSGAVASGAQSVALGNDTVASGTSSMALGNDARAEGDNSIALGAGSVAVRPNTVSVGSVGNERTLSNVAAGVQGTDAVNVDQLQQSQAGTAHYDAAAGGGTDYANLSLGGPGGTTTTRVHNVSAGVAPTDAVNVQQLDNGLAQARQYTDQRLQDVGQDMWTMRREMRGGTASAMAMAGMPQAYEPGRNMMAVGVGGFQGEVGMAVGMSRVSESGRYLMQAQLSGNTTHDFGFSVGAGLQW